LIAFWTLGQFPCEGVFSSTSANNEYIHGFKFRDKDKHP